MSHAIIELVTTIIVYKFGQMSRVEVEAMLGLSLQETRVYQEAKAEGQQEGELIGEERGRRQEATNLALKLLTRRFNQELPEQVRSQIESLTLPQLEALTETLLDFTQMNDLLSWFESNQLSETNSSPEAEN